ncbi:MAG: radical SAM protein [Clostridia bacterium]|nr:radical SAM protein [Clostridia bacterium]
MKDNKYVKVRGKIKINLYVPGFPSRAFFNACYKVLEFDNKMPCISALISITSACRYKCPHCYQRFDKGKDTDIDTLVDVINKLQDKGIAFFNIEGGEPFLVFDRLMKVCEAIDDRSEILINSTGDGMTIENITRLKEQENIMGIMFSLHTPESETLNQFMDNEHAWKNMVNGINLCHKVGMPVTFNTCLLREDFYNGKFEQVVEISKELKGSIMQLIKPKPAGGWLTNRIEPFSEEDTRLLLKKVDRYNLDKKNRAYPFVSPMIREESEEFFGCTAGATDRFYINAKGDLQPCEFLNISFGNIVTDDFDRIYDHMREVFRTPSTCLLCEKFSGKIAELKKEHNLKTLPLTKEFSRKIYENWKLNGPAQFYEKIEKL